MTYTDYIKNHKEIEHLKLTIEGLEKKKKHIETIQRGNIMTGFEMVNSCDKVIQAELHIADQRIPVFYKLNFEHRVIMRKSIQLKSGIVYVTGEGYWNFEETSEHAMIAHAVKQLEKHLEVNGWKLVTF